MYLGKKTLRIEEKDHCTVITEVLLYSFGVEFKTSVIIDELVICEDNISMSLSQFQEAEAAVNELLEQFTGHTDVAA